MCSTPCVHMSDYSTAFVVQKTTWKNNHTFYINFLFLDRQRNQYLISNRIELWKFTVTMQQSALHLGEISHIKGTIYECRASTWWASRLVKRRLCLATRHDRHVAHLCQSSYQQTPTFQLAVCWFGKALTFMFWTEIMFGMYVSCFRNMCKNRI